MRCFSKLFAISYRDHITNDAVRDRIRQAIGLYDDILTTVKKHKLKWFGHVSISAGRAKTSLQGKVQGGKRRGRQKKCWENNISEWTGLKFCDALRESEIKIKWRVRVVSTWPLNSHYGYGIGARCMSPSIQPVGPVQPQQEQRNKTQISTGMQLLGSKYK